jgi:hypothetical protein
MQIFDDLLNRFSEWTFAQHRTISSFLPFLCRKIAHSITAKVLFLERLEV